MAAPTVSRGPLPEESAEVTPAEMVPRLGGGGGVIYFMFTVLGTTRRPAQKSKRLECWGKRNQGRGAGGGGGK